MYVIRHAAGRHVYTYTGFVAEWPCRRLVRYIHNTVLFCPYTIAARAGTVYSLLVLFSRYCSLVLLVFHHRWHTMRAYCMPALGTRASRSQTGRLVGARSAKQGRRDGLHS